MCTHNTYMAMNPVIILIVGIFLSFAFTIDARTRVSYSHGKSICKSFVERRGYACQEHKVTTKDGYRLTMQRIPVGRSGRQATKPPVLLQHGLLADAATWVMTPTDLSLAFLLADEGHDVWLANSRGTLQSLTHTNLSSADPAFWEWSWDELVAYDLPAVLCHVHNTTKQRFHYVGHSMGTLIALASLSKHEFTNIRSAALLSPIAYVNQMPSFLARAAANNFLADQLYRLGQHKFVPRGRQMIKFVHGICQLPGLDCSDMLSILTGPNCCLDRSSMRSFIEYGVQQTSMKNMIHLAQMVRRGTVAMFDYGNIFDNLNHYEQTTPPTYNLTSIPRDFPLYISYGGKDELSDVKDVRVLLDCLKKYHDKRKLVVQYKKEYAHLDFIFGLNANEVVYHPLMAFFDHH